MFYLIDKPLGISSFDVIRQLRRTLGIKKMGHAGTLDPLATGCLLVATENSTKLIPFLDGSDKTYIFSVAIDGTSPSLDLGTDITYTQSAIYKDKTPTELRDLLLHQTEQIPPKYSALHIDGKRSYELARQGIDITIDPRPITVKEVEILSFNPPFFTIKLRISSGGYIRSFAPLIGEFFGMPGGYITSLRRTSIHTDFCTLGEDISTDLDTISLDKIIDRGYIFSGIKSVQIDESIFKKLKEGRVIEPFMEGTIGCRYFFDFPDVYSSLVELQSDGFHIIRNDI